MANGGNNTTHLFEVSWEVCNKVGGIYTVITTKAPQYRAQLGDNYMLIGPDVWKETINNPYFEEDKYSHKGWRDKATADGFKFKIGRFKDADNAIAIILDFTTYFEKRDDILYQMWKDYGVDSFGAGWDYFEPVLFGYAAARLIEHFYTYNNTERDVIKAHFHEWMTGSGILYLKRNTPQIGTVFTTHATVLGRSMVGNGWNVYDNLSKYNAESAAKELGVMPKHSMERASANAADVFTTVSHATSLECKYLLGRDVDVITPNGFDGGMIPSETKHQTVRVEARKRMLIAAEALINKRFSDDSMLITTSGRYEFHNKGLDLFIDALGRLDKSGALKRDVLAFVMVPANHIGARSELLANYERCIMSDRGAMSSDNNALFVKPNEGDYSTHKLVEPQNDKIINKLRENGLVNGKGNRVNVIFIPAYLDGNDGIINMHYYDVLQGFDLSVYPSIYEPWGYTPMESIAYSVPTVTSTLAGFGQWVNEKVKDVEEINDAVLVLNRTQSNYSEAADELAKYLFDFSTFEGKEMRKICDRAKAISRSFYWEYMFLYYATAYEKAGDMVEMRYDLYKGKQIADDHNLSLDSQNYNKPEWRKVYVKSEIPAKYAELDKLSKNIWWVWNYDAYQLWEMIYDKGWRSSEHNPVKMLETLNNNRWKELEEDEAFEIHYNKVIKSFDAYMNEAKNKPEDMVAYFSMEYGLHDSIKIFSGGLGMLAGDYMKEASDSNVNMVGVGLLYRYGYFKQKISPTGEQQAEYIPQKFTQMPLVPVKDADGNWVKISMALPGRTLTAKAWCVNVGRIPLYLLDTDIEENTPEDRRVTHQLYGGDWDNRFKQELLLGVGGIRLINALGLKPAVYHCNEGHAAFIGLERLKGFIQESGLSFSEAVEVVRSTSLFTTHTPVPAGHDAFDENTIRTYLSHYPDRLRISWNQFMNLGRTIPNDSTQKFSMSVLALRLSENVNGVSRIHGRVSREMFANMFPGYYPKELYIDYVTNGVHYYTWTARSWQKLYAKYFGDGFLKDQSNPTYWSNIYKVPDSEIWDIRCDQKVQMLEYLKERVAMEMSQRNENPKLILKTITSFNKDSLIIGFARRFATYKRAHLLFMDLEHLSKLVNNHEKPIMFIFAGKAHPYDLAGQGLIRRIIEVSRMPEFIGKILFVENYNMSLAKYLIRGVDVWMNTPTRPLEASGTSGEKAIMNGTLNISVLDGWWAEGYVEGAGWALKEEQTYPDNGMQDQLDAQIIYSLFEDEISPIYYNKDKSGMSAEWIQYIKNCIAKIDPHFTMKRQLDDYYSKFYNKMIVRSKKLITNDYELAKDLTTWKQRIRLSWNQLEVVSIKTQNFDADAISINDTFEAEVEIRTNELKAENVGLEVLFCHKERDVVTDYEFKYEMDLVSTNGGTATYKCSVPIERAGVFNFVFRAYPKNELLPHRQDLPLVRWM